MSEPAFRSEVSVRMTIPVALSQIPVEPKVVFAYL